MGIAPAMIKLLMREGKQEVFSGHALTIGRQNISPMTIRDLEKLAKEINFKLRPFPGNTHLDNKTAKNSFVTDKVLFLSMGFNGIDSIDYSDFEQCAITHDLNTNVPENLYNKYDLIFDGGSTEHIFNVPKALENYNKMLKIGGRIIHALPSNGLVDHGFYMFSPTLFWDYYLANSWDIKEALFIRHPKDADKGLWDIYCYSPHCLDMLSYLGLDKSKYAIYFVVKKTDKSTFNAPVQQGFYLEAWNGISNTKNVKFKTLYSGRKKIANLLPERLKVILRPLYLSILSRIPIRFFLKTVGKY